MRWKRLLIGAVAALVAVVGTAAAASQGVAVFTSDAPDLVLVNGKVAIADEANTFVEAVAIRDGIIVAAGPNGPVRALARRDTRIVDLGGRTVVPGLIDGTLHGLRNGFHCFSRAVRLDATFSRSGALAAYAARGAEVAPNAWIFTTAGWTVRQLDIPGMFTLAELDAALPDHPVWVQGFGFAGVQVNSAALNALDLQAGDPGVETVAGSPTGKLTGAALEAAALAIQSQLEALTIDQQTECLADFIRDANRMGLTSWDDPGGNSLPFLPGAAGGTATEALSAGHGYQAVNQLARDGELNARVVINLNARGLEGVLSDTTNAFSMVGDDRLRIGGVGEEVMTAVNGAYPQPEYGQIVEHLIANRWRLEHHASLGTTQDSNLDAWEAAVEAVGPISELQWIMLHPRQGPVYPTEDTLDRLEDLGAGTVLTTDGVRGTAEHPPYRRVFESGVRMCLGTDAMNIAPYPPFVTLWYTISGQTLDPSIPGVAADQRLTREQALRAATADCAWFMLQSGRLGSIEPGKHADLIVLSDDYFTVPVDEIRTITSVLTLVGGEVVFADAEFSELDPG